MHHVLQRLDGEIGIHGAGAIADQQREVHHLARLAALHDQRDLGARFLFHQVVVYRGQRQQRWDGRIVLVHALVGDDQQRVAGGHGKRGTAGQRLQPALQPQAALVHLEGRGERRRQQVAG